MEVKTIEDIRKAIPTSFKRGEGLAGPEFYGCCNSGMRPVITRLPYKEVKDMIILVGGEIPIADVRFQVARDHLAGKRRFQYGENNRAVYTFKSMANAVPKFLELCKAVMDWNEQQHREHAEALKAARNGDLGALLTAAEF